MSVFRDLLMTTDKDISLNYLQSTGTQYIDTGITLTQNSNFDLKYELPVLNAQDFIFGTRNETGSRVPAHCHFNNSTYGLYYLYDNSDYSRWTNAITQTYPLQIYLMARYRSVEYRNFERTTAYWTHTYNARTGDDLGSATLFAAKRFTTESDYDILNAINVKIYEYIIYDESDTSIITHHFIPVLHKNIPCMKDEITGEYYYNVGTGTFLYG